MLHVGTASGAVYLIDARSRAVLGVHQLHDGPVHALVVAPGFVATAGGDRLLRLWGRDLREMYMEVGAGAVLFWGGGQGRVGAVAGHAAVATIFGLMFV